ncbi:retrovirus-related Pol polyprotein from transposon 297 [Trichonephila clavipes]|uniref:Retrovirus-related Pol polyprotein from transposon 297 n=1 Tax=Trichonephila clavipes TaxID=2585209 RepID=A0A8X6WHT1_TRICX|nr:retrovirus-related Pol polyprotein from transposon 297 [Trichonephila clavipes]
MRMDIELISDKPIKTKPYRMSPRQINILREEIKLESPNKDPRPCVDYRRLNEITRAEFFPLPNIKEIVENTIASPLTDALKGKIKKEKITWDEKCGKAFEELKAKLVSQPILFAPDFATDFILQTDASEVGAGVVLSQRIEGEEHPIVFLSKKFSKAERNYSTVERELTAIIFGLKRLKHYLDGQKFIIETDHNPLRYLNKMGSTNPRTILDRVLGARAAGVHYRLFSVGTLVPVRRDQQLSDHSTVDEIASGAADCRLTYTMANCPQRRNEKVSNHGSIPITIDSNVVGFIVFEEGFHQPIKRTKQSVFRDVTVFRHTLVDYLHSKCGNFVC